MELFEYGVFIKFYYWIETWNTLDLASSLKNTILSIQF